MKRKGGSAGEVDAYIAGFPEDVRVVLERVRATVRAAAPGATERMSYGIPTFFLNGNLVHFAAFKGHVGFYPGPAAIAKFRREFSAYGTSKGTVRFPLGEPLPLELIAKITRFRAAENAERA